MPGALPFLGSYPSLLAVTLVAYVVAAPIGDSYSQTDNGGKEWHASGALATEGGTLLAMVMDVIARHDNEIKYLSHDSVELTLNDGDGLLNRAVQLDSSSRRS